VTDGFTVDDIRKGLAHAVAVGDHKSVAGLRARLAAAENHQDAETEMQQ
jgi:hypothetical protein